jgi:hypothetical protein
MMDTTMANWLVCFSAEVTAARRTAIIDAAGAHCSARGDPVPLGAEVAVHVEADAAAIATLRANDEVRGVFPDSEQTPY